MFFRFQPFQGPSRFVFKDPDTGTEFNEPSKPLLIKRITDYRSANNLETIDNLGTVLEHYWCTLPENHGKCVPMKLERGFMGYLKGGVALIRNMVYNSYADTKEAERRAAICVQCPNNIFPDKEAFIKWSDEVAHHSLGGRSTTKDKELGSCEVCTCPLRVKVHMGGTDFGTENVNDKFPSFCWQKK